MTIEMPESAQRTSNWFWLLRDPKTGWPRRPVVFIVCVALALLLAAWLRPDQSLTPAALRALYILVLAVLLWSTEAIPAFAVGLLVIALNVALLGRPDGVFAKDSDDWEQFLAVFGHPLIWLFFGGFVMAAGMEKCGLDRRLAVGLLRRLGGSYRSVLFGSMLATFVLSMFMSNTATTAMILAVLAPLLRQCDDHSNAARGLLLGVAVAANLGGMGSLIGTPPNAIAVAALDNLDPPQVVSFLDWMVFGLPPALLLLALSARLLIWMYPEPDRVFRIETIATPKTPGNTLPFIVVCSTVLVTIGLWLTSSWHRIPTAAVSLLPIVVLTSTRILTANDIRRMHFDVLFLIAGGLALGNAVTSTGLANWMASRLPLGSLGPEPLALAISYITLTLSNFMSATATANIFIPLLVSLNTNAKPLIVIAAALSISCGMCLPVSTPPNAMVCATGRLKIWDLIYAGLVIGVTGPLLIVAWLSLMLFR
jgi:solute carrier family 13 (sodium-dependent dicarboxylate transporter), member 2/3/5